MSRRRRALSGAALLGLALLSGAAAVPGPAPASDGAFERLSPMNQKIARALHEGQKQRAGVQVLTVDEIAARKEQSRGWGAVFKSMKAAGLVDEQSIADVLRRYNNRLRLSTRGTLTTGRNRTERVQGPFPWLGASRANAAPAPAKSPTPAADPGAAAAATPAPSSASAPAANPTPAKSPAAAK